jgi:hypothetical protein
MGSQMGYPDWARRGARRGARRAETCWRFLFLAIALCTISRHRHALPEAHIPCHPALPYILEEGGPIPKGGTNRSGMSFHVPLCTHIVVMFMVHDVEEAGCMLHVRVRQDRLRDARTMGSERQDASVHPPRRAETQRRRELLSMP